MRGVTVAAARTGVPLVPRARLRVQNARAGRGRARVAVPLLSRVMLGSALLLAAHPPMERTNSRVDHFTGAAHERGMEPRAQLFEHLVRLGRDVDVDAIVLGRATLPCARRR